MTNDSRPLILYADGKEVADGCRIRVQGRSNMTLFPDCYIVSIYNVSSQDASRISNARRITVTGEDNSVFCYGEIADRYLHTSDLAAVTSLTIADGKTFWETTVAKSVGAGSTVRSAINAIKGSCQFGAFIADDVKMLRGQTFVGRLADQISVMAKTLGARAFFTHGMIHIVKPGQAANIVTIPESDLLDESSTADGILILKTKVKGYPVGVIASYGRRRYRLIAQAINADNWSGLWQAELMLLDETLLGPDEMGGG